MKCALPSDPDDPSNTTLSLLLETSDFQKSDTSVTDTVGKTIRIGLCLEVRKYIDSINVTIGTSEKNDTIIEISKEDLKKDTIYYEMVFSTAGTRTVSAIAYVANEFKKKTAKIHIIARPVPNRKPELAITGKKEIVAGELCTLIVSVEDPDSGQLHDIDSTKFPEDGRLVDSLFTWQTTEADTGEISITFIVQDDGTPPLSDTDKVIITVSERSVNTAPQWSVEVVPLNIHINELCTLELENLCEDPDGDKLTFMLVDGEPAGDTITEDTYRFTSTDESAGSYSVKIVASDPDGETDTLLVELTVDASDTDTTAPAITIVSPLDNAAVSSATIEIDAICSDASGIKTVTASTADSTVELQEQEGHYKGEIDLVSSSNTITIEATDASPDEITATKQVTVTYSPTFAVTYNGNENTSGSVPTDTNRYEEGHTVTVQGNSGDLIKTGSAFTGWNIKSDGNGTGYAAGDTFSMPGADVTLYAQWTPIPTYTLNITVENGSVSRSPDLAEYDSGTVVTLTPVPSNGYHFTGWSGALTGSDNPATITIDSDKSVTAEFAANQPNSYSLTVLATNGTVEKTPDQVQYESGTEVGLKATPNTGYKFVNWSGDADGTIDETTVTMDDDKTVSAIFELLTYTLALNAETGGTISEPSSSATVNHGAATTITASPNSGYRFNEWTVTSGSAVIDDSSSASTSVSLASGNATVSASFIRLTYQLTVNAETGGTISEPSSPATVNHGAATTITASANSGYRFNGWTVTSGTAIIDDDSLVSTSVTLTSGNATVTANFILKRYQVAFDTHDGTPVAPDTVNHGSLLTEPTSTRSGLSLVGWYTEAEYQNLWYFSSDAVTIPISLHAKWQVRDKDGNVYDTIRIGNQTWMSQNFRCTVYNDSTELEYVTDSAQWVGLSAGEIGAYCFYNNSTSTTFTQKFGALYNWYAVNNAEFAPAGWRVPTAADWDELEAFVEANYSSRVGKELASNTDWNYGPNEGSVGNDQESNNATEFNAYPGGDRRDGAFNQMGNTGFWWTADSDPVDTDIAVNRYIAYYFSVLYSNTTAKSVGYSVRLIKIESQ